MGRFKFFFLIIIFMTRPLIFFANEITDKCCGTWVAINGRNEIVQSISISKVNENNYYVIYHDNRSYYDNQGNLISNFYSFAEYGIVKENKIWIETKSIKESDIFYVLLLIEEAKTLYVMCNHEELIYPWSESDMEFIRISDMDLNHNDISTKELFNILKSSLWENIEKIGNDYVQFRIDLQGYTKNT